MALSVNIFKELDGFKLNVQLEAGAAPLALLGASGSGKTVTLKCIAGVMTPDRGRITLDGEVLYDSEQGVNLPPQKRRVGLLFQQYALFPHMTVRQNIASAVRNRRDRVRITDEKLYQYRLADVADKRPGQISGGQQQRTALARILVSDPAVILLDEPFAALDSYLKFQMELEMAEELEDFAGPLVWVTHDRGEVYRNCRYVCVLEDGHSQEITTVTGLFTHPGTEGAARLSGCANYADAIPRESAVYLPQWGVTLRCANPLPPFLWRIGIRARHVRLSNPGMTNAFAVETVRVVEDVFSTFVLLRPVGAAADAPLLTMELEKAEWQTVPDKRRLTVAVSPQDILMLH